MPNTVTLERLAVELVANGSKLRAEFKQSTRASKDWANKTRAATDSTARFIFKSATVAAAALTTMYVANARALDSLAKTTDKLGELPEELVGLQHAAEITGNSIETTNTALQRMVRRVAEAARGSGEAKDVIKELGLDAGELARQTPVQQFREFAGAMQNVKTQGDRVRIAMKLFDTEGVSLVNTLALGKDGLAAMSTEAEQLGLTVSRVDLAKVEAANDEFARARATTVAFGRSLAVEVAPLVGAISEQFREASKEAGGFGVVAVDVVDSVVTGFSYLADTIHGVRAVWKGLTALVADAIADQLEGIALVDSGLRKLINLIPGLEVQTEGFLQNLAQSFRASADQLATEFNEFALQPLPGGKIRDWVEDVREKAQAAAEQVAAERQKNIGDTLLGLDSSGQLSAENEKIISLQREKFRRIHEAALEAEGRQREVERLRFERQ